MMSLRKINAALAAAGIEATLARGKGYFYFVGPKADLWPTSSVMVCYLNQLTIRQWVEAYRELESHSQL